MSKQLTSQKLTRREFLKAVGLGAAGTVAAGWLGSGLGRGLSMPVALAATKTLSLVGTDGYVNVPGRPGNPLYIFGFVQVPGNLTVSQLITQYKGHAQTSAPTLDFKQGDDMKITLTNLGLVQRPDLTDSHTLHWHGFDIPSPLNDGVPEVSVGVPIGKQLTYFYRPHREGTYMWHCHFEDVEHVQMGMTGIVFVRPAQENGQTWGGFTQFAYNDGNTGLTGYKRHFAILLNEFWHAFHDGDRDIQESVATDYDPEWFTLNGRCYPETVLPNDVGARFDSNAGTTISLPVVTDPAITAGDVGKHVSGPGIPPGTTITSVTPAVSFVMSASATATASPVTVTISTSGLTTEHPNYGTFDASLPNSALIQVKEFDRVLLRLANLGYQQHAMELPGIQMHVIGQDASWLRNGAVDTSYWTNTLYIGPGEARDVLFNAPAYSASLPGGPASGSLGAYNVYYFKNRDWRKLSNNGLPGPGGMMTEVRVYQALPTQTVVSQTYV